MDTMNAIMRARYWLAVLAVCPALMFADHHIGETDEMGTDVPTERVIDMSEQVYDDVNGEEVESVDVEETDAEVPEEERDCEYYQNQLDDSFEALEEAMETGDEEVIRAAKEKYDPMLMEAGEKLEEMECDE